MTVAEAFSLGYILGFLSGGAMIAVILSQGLEHLIISPLMRGLRALLVRSDDR